MDNYTLSNGAVLWKKFAKTNTNVNRLCQPTKQLRLSCSLLTKLAYLTTGMLFVLPLVCTIRGLVED